MSGARLDPCLRVVGLSESCIDFDVQGSATKVIAITPTNDPPVPKDQEITLLEDGVIQGTLEAFDPESDPLSFSLGCPPQHGQVELLAGHPSGWNDFRYIPDPNYSGSDSFVFIASDGEAGSAGLVSP